MLLRERQLAAELAKTYAVRGPLIFEAVLDRVIQHV